MSRTTHATSSSATGPPASSLSRAPSLRSAGPSPSTDVALFVTNLRLLDFDLLPDWPEITAQTFSTKDAQQNQKNRIRCVEWALFRLFEAYDLEETRENLQPFFPPLVPLQSINLRAALYRSLEKLKKNGILGRETVLRKSMLDECKGDKLIEILIIFSTAVLQHAVLTKRRRRKRHVPIAQRVATTGRLGAEDQASLLPLAIAHKAALTEILRNKNEQRAQYQAFEEFLELKSREIQTQNGECNAALEILESSEKEPADAGTIQRILNQNWLGNREWLEVMVHGESSYSDDRLFGKSFGEIWPSVKEGEQLDESSVEKGLLEDLEARVKGQQDRLQRWKAFQASVSQDVGARRSHSTPRKRGSQQSFGFDRHQELRLRTQGSEIPPERPTSRHEKSKLAREYDDILTAMRSSLVEASNARVERKPPPKRAPPPRTTSIPISSASRDLNPPASKVIPRVVEAAAPQIEVSLSPVKSVHDEAPPTEAGAEEDESRHSISPRPVTAVSLASDQQSDAFSLLDAYIGGSPEAVKQVHPESPDASRQQDSLGDLSASPGPPSEPDVEPPQQYSPGDIEERMAEDILASVAEGTPSPVKKPRPRLSLMERTRLTMMGQSASLMEEDEDEAPSPTKDAVKLQQNTTELERRGTLLERTQASMALMEKLPPRPQPPKSHRSMSGKSRQSAYPVNQWESPRKVSPLFEDVGEQEPSEDLFAGDVQYGDVFKSRPKIAVSPVMTPRVDDSVAEMDMDEMLDGRSDDGDENEDCYGSSPLKGRRR